MKHLLKILTIGFLVMLGVLVAWPASSYADEIDDDAFAAEYVTEEETEETIAATEEIQVLTEEGPTEEGAETGTRPENLSQPVITFCDMNESGGISVFWRAVEGAEGYTVYRRASETAEWSVLGTTAGTTWFSPRTLVNGRTYSYMVEAFRGEETGPASEIAQVTFVAEVPDTLDAPVITYCENNENSGITLVWRAVNGAERYIVYRRAGETGSWSRLGETTKTNWISLGRLTSGIKYYFRVEAANANGTSDPSEAASEVYLAPVKVTGMTGDVTGILVEWERVAGAARYYVYRRAQGQTDWALIGYTTNNYWKNTGGLEYGKNYTYLIKAYSAEAGMGSFATTAYTTTRLAPAAVTSCVGVQDQGITVTWRPVVGATSYLVYRREGTTGSWKLLGRTTRTVWNSNTGMNNGETYYFRVRAVNDTSTGVFSAIKSAVYTCSNGWRNVNGSAVYYRNNVEVVRFSNLMEAFTWSSSAISYQSVPAPPAGASYVDYYSELGLNNRAGNCYVMAAVFVKAARTLGYQAQLQVGTVGSRGGGMIPHGWVEIVVDGVTYVCDPDFTYETHKNGLLIHYGDKGTWRYGDHASIA